MKPPICTRFISRAIIFLGAISVWSCSEKPKLDSDLSEIPSFFISDPSLLNTKNGYNYYLQLEGLNTEKLKNGLEDYIDIKSPATAAKNFIAQHNTVLDLWGKAAKAKQAHAPTRLSLDASMPELGPMLSASKLQSIKANILRLEGKPKESIEEHLINISNAHKILNAHGPVIVTLTGITIRSAAIDNINNIITSEKLPSDYLKSLSSRINNWESIESSFSNAMKIEYTALKGALIENPEKCFNELFESAKELTNPNYDPDQDKNKGKIKIREDYYNPITTLQKIYDSYAMLAEKSKSPYCNGFASAYEEIMAETERIKKLTRERAYSENYQGDILYSLLIPMLIGIPEIIYANQAEYRALTIKVAFKAYKSNHHKIPPMLNALTPTYLDSIPHDPYSGKPFVYSKDKNEIYSTGKSCSSDIDTKSNKSWKL